MKTIGIREAKNRLSAHLREVQRGRVIRITDRGRVVAELRPVALGRSGAELYEELVRQGKVIPPQRSRPRPLPVPRKKPRLPRGTARALIDADRQERR